MEPGFSVYGGYMISKETFCKALALIYEQRETDRKVTDALQLVGDGPYVFGTENKYLEGLLMVLKEAVGDQYDYISWWLYDTDDYRVWSEDESKVWDLKEPEALYDYIITECQLAKEKRVD